MCFSSGRKNRSILRLASLKNLPQPLLTASSPISLCRIPESQHGGGWKGPLWVTQPNPLLKKVTQSRLHSTASRRGLNTSRGRGRGQPTPPGRLPSANEANTFRQPSCLPAAPTAAPEAHAPRTHAGETERQPPAEPPASERVEPPGVEPGAGSREEPVEPALGARVALPAVDFSET